MYFQKIPRRRITKGSSGEYVNNEFFFRKVVNTKLRKMPKVQQNTSDRESSSRLPHPVHLSRSPPSPLNSSGPQFGQRYAIRFFSHARELSRRVPPYNNTLTKRKKRRATCCELESRSAKELHPRPFEERRARDLSRQSPSRINTRTRAKREKEKKR